MFVSKAAVVGGGTMGGEIAQAIAAADIPVVVKDIDQKFVDAAVEKARAVTEGQLARLVKKEKLTQEQADARLAEVMGLITGTTSYEEFGDVDFVIEAVPEKMEIKQAVFRELDAATPGHAILASNTSSLSITEIGEATLRPDKVVGFHFFYPASVMPLVEVIVGEDTSPETATAAYNFAQAIKKQPIVCGEVPGFVVNRILMATIGEIWRAQEEQGLSLKAIDEAIAAANVAPMGPFFLTDLLGLDTVLHVAEHLNESYGETFYVHQGLQAAGRRRQARCQVRRRGLLQGRRAEHPRRRRSRRRGAGRPVHLPGADRGLSAGRGGRLLGPRHRPRDDGRRRARPPPRPAAAVLESRRRGPRLGAGADGAAGGEARRALRAARHAQAPRRPGPPRPRVRPGLLPLPAARRGRPGGDGEAGDPRRRRDRLARQRADERRLPRRDPRPEGTVWEKVKAAGEIGAMVIASSVPIVFSAGADIKAFTQMDEAGGEELINTAHALLRDFGQAKVATIAAVNAIAFGGGCEVAMACDVRIAAEAAVFGQPEIKLGIIPGFGGTQRLPRLVGENKALEMNLIGDAIPSDEALEFGLVNRVVPDHELFETALMWGRKLAAQAPLAVEQIKLVSHKGDLDEGIEAEKQGFATAFGSEDAKEGIGAFLGKRTPKWSGK